MAGVWIFRAEPMEKPHECDLPSERPKVDYFGRENRTDASPGSLFRCECGRLWVVEVATTFRYWSPAGIFTRLAYRGEGHPPQ
jgi:hypothetical protein